MNRQAESITFSLYVIIVGFASMLQFLYGNIIVNAVALIVLIMLYRFEVHTRIGKIIWALFVFTVIRGGQIYRFVFRKRKIKMPHYTRSIAAIGELLSQKRAYNEFYVSVDPKIKLKVGRNHPHILIAGRTGNGKTNEVNMILTQLFAQGDLFRSRFEVCIIDLKPGQVKSDYDAWRPHVDHFSYIDEDGENHAIETLNYMYGLRTTREVLLIVDETASIENFDRPNRRTGNSLIKGIARTMRQKGTFIMITQYPNFDSVGSVVARDQFGIRIAFRMEKDPMKVSLGEMPRSIPRQVGEFAMIDARGKQRFGRSLPVLKRDIELAISRSRNISVDLTDVRYVILRAALSGLSVGDSATGVNQLYQALGLPAQDVKTWMRNFEEWGIFERTIGNQRKLLVHPDEAAAIVIRRHRDDLSG